MRIFQCWDHFCDNLDNLLDIAVCHSNRQWVLW